MFDFPRKSCFAVMLLLTMAALGSVTAQDYDWSDEDLPEWLEDVGYEDADYDGPDMGAAGRASAGITSDRTGQRRCNKCGCIHCRDQLTGDWGGCRKCLAQNGIVYRGRVTQYFFGVGGGIQEPVPPPFGAIGFDPGDAFEYTGNSQHDFLFDLEKFGGPKAGKFVLTLEQLWGNFGNVWLNTGSSTPTHFNALQPFDPAATGAIRMTNFLYVQPLSERLIISAGKTRLVGTADRNVFAGGDGSDQFMNQNFVANPLFLDTLVISSFSVGAVMPREWGNIAIRVIDPLERSTDFFDFGDLFADGMVLLGQVRVNTNFFCKPGEHHIGAIYKNVDLPDLTVTPVPPQYPYPPAPPGIRTKSETYTLFYGFDQYIAVYETAPQRGDVPGWGLFGRAGLSDGGSGNPAINGWHVSLGIGGDSPLYGRRDKNDRFGIGYAYTATTDEWGPVPQAAFSPRDSQVFETFYRYQVTPAISITPDLQWIRGNLSGLTGGDDAFVYGLRMNIRL